MIEFHNRIVLLVVFDHRPTQHSERISSRECIFHVGSRIVEASYEIRMFVSPITIMQSGVPSKADAVVIGQKPSCKINSNSTITDHIMELVDACMRRLITKFTFLSVEEEQSLVERKSKILGGAAVGVMVRQEPEDKKDDEWYENERKQDGEEALEACLVGDSEVEVDGFGEFGRRGILEGGRRREKGEAKFNGVPTTGRG